MLRKRALIMYSREFAPVHGLVVSMCEPGRHWFLAPYAAHPFFQQTRETERRRKKREKERGTGSNNTYSRGPECSTC